ncbi:MAG: tetratricopeptide repeat protein [Saprospiraceae bacterium]|nr:tetratricopeptide repeat protein [Saprospiraceae bacterium]
MKTLLFSFSFFLSLFLYSQNQPITIGERMEIESQILQETRAVNIYLPQGYHMTSRATYPVLYMLDGDYNFHYVTGMIDQMASISEIIQECIVVGIADKGHDRYVESCTPFDKKNNPAGNAENVLRFITEELRPFLSSNYRISDFDMLAGHSLGGLFVIHSLLSKPESFNAYIAISPSLWWNDYQVEKEVEGFFKKHENLQRSLFLSVGNEKGMGILGFQNQLDIQTFADEYYGNTPLGLDYHFNIFPDENHNSVGLISIKTALESLFEKYELNPADFENVETLNDYLSLISPLREQLGAGFRLPTRQLKTAIEKAFQDPSFDVAAAEKVISRDFSASLGDFYLICGQIFIKKGKTESGETYLQKSINREPNDVNSWMELGQYYSKAGEKEKALANYEKAHEITTKIKVPRWVQNELNARILGLKDSSNK